MSKYDPLGSYLRMQPAAHVPMTFADIEKIIGFSLPAVAKSARAWWSNNPSNNVMTKVWTAAGFRSEQVDIAGEKLVFRRQDTEEPRPAPVSPAGRPHPIFGCLKGMATIAGGVDVSAPADAAWGDAAR